MNISQLAQLSQMTGENQAFEFATVLQVSRNGIVLKLSNGSTVIGQQAFSCAFKPEKEDFVMIVRTPETGTFVLDILKRNSEKAALLSVNRELEIRSSESVKFQTQDLNLNSVSTKMTSQAFQMTSELIDVNAEQTRFQSRNVETVMERMIQKVKDSFKFIERLEQVTAKDIVQNIKNAFLQRSKQVDMTAKGDVKINGERIHMG